MYFKLFVEGYGILFVADTEKLAVERAKREIQIMVKGGELINDGKGAELWYIKDYEVAFGDMWYSEGASYEQKHLVKLG